MGESKLDAYIKAFVLKKTVEKVEVHLKTSITIKSVLKKGSTTLATLWANVLQEKDNFPTSKFAYKTLLDKATGTEKLIVKAEDITFTIWMSTGSLMIQGTYVYEWFTRRFKEVLDNFDPEFQKSWVHTPIKKPVYEGEEEELPYKTSATEEYLLMMTKKHIYDADFHKRFEVTADEIIPGLQHLRLDKGIWEGDDLQGELDSLSTGAVKDGLSYVYKLWKSLLNKWFSEEETKLYLASPFLDADRLKDVISYCLEYRSKGQLEVFYVRQKCDEFHSMSASDVKHAALQAFDSKQKTFIEYKILHQMIYPVQRFHCKFFAGVHGDQADVVLTSANFHGNHFDCKNMETVQYLRMSKADFLQKFVDPIASPVIATTY